MHIASGARFASRAAASHSLRRLSSLSALPVVGATRLSITATPLTRKAFLCTSTTKPENDTNPTAQPTAEEVVDKQDVAEQDVAEQVDEKPVVEEKYLQETEAVTGATQESVFQAETAKLLEIVAKSLYTDKEVFIRELISNASDALEKLRYHSVAKGGMDVGELRIELAGDEDNKTLTIADNGIGMTKEELHDNLGTIARSGSLAFVKEIEGGASPDEVASHIIGRFGVGFYSVFMVGESVKVYSRSAKSDDPGHCWFSTGDGKFSLGEAEGVKRGTKIIIKLRKDCEMFASKSFIKTVVDKFSNFVPFHVLVNGERCNKVEAIWMKHAKDITEQEHNDFYRYVSSSYDTPMYKLVYSADAPVAIKSVFYVPQTHTEKYGMGRMDAGVNLFSRRVMIKPRCKELLPDWLRFLKGVVDSEDIPLNISRENMQDTQLMRKLNTVLTKRALKWLYDESQADEAKFNLFFKEFGHFLKEGCVTALAHKEAVAKLLRFESSAMEEGKLVSLEDYVKRMNSNQKHIYYLCAPTRSFALSSPYYEAFKQQGVEVLFLYQTIDDFVMTNLYEFDGKRLISAESSDVDLSKVEAEPKAKEDGKTDEKLNTEDATAMADWLKTTLADRVKDVKVSERLVSSPAVVTGHESAAMRKMMQLMDGGQTVSLSKQNLEINPSHEIIVGLSKLRYAQPDLASNVANQILDNALIAAGLLDDARAMLPRINTMLSSLLNQKQ